ncbi:MAG: AEC family transporter [Sulfuricellaceae bacterium]|nr:AEC family transporter [Sulfuricellaceae bacterium]
MPPVSMLPLIVEVMLPIALLVGAGGVWPRHGGEVPPALLRVQLNRLALNVFVPALMFAIGASFDVTLDLLTVPLLYALGVAAGSVLLYWLLYRSAFGARLDDAGRAALMIGGLFGNTFYIGLPILTMVYGPQAARYPAYNDMLAAVPLVWSLGVAIATRLGPGRGAVKAPPLWRTLAVLPPLWGFAAGIAVHYSGLDLGAAVRAAHLIGQATVPVMMFVLGLSIPWRQLRPDRYILAVALVKLAVIPALVWGMASQLFFPVGEPQYAAIIESSMPSMVMLLVLADRFKLDTERAALLVGWTTLLMWLALPFWIWIGKA